MHSPNLSRSTHINALTAAAKEGKYTLGGGTLSAPPSETDGKLLLDGSVVIAVADTEAEGRALLSEDIYAKSGVWNVDGAQSIPMKCAIRIGL